MLQSCGEKTTTHFILRSRIRRDGAGENKEQLLFDGKKYVLMIVKNLKDFF